VSKRRLAAPLERAAAIVGSERMAEQGYYRRFPNVCSFLHSIITAIFLPSSPCIGMRRSAAPLVFLFLRPD